MPARILSLAVAVGLGASALGVGHAEPAGQSSGSEVRHSRLSEIVRLIETGDRAAARAFVATAMAPSEQERGDRIVELFSKLHDNSRGVDDVRTSADGANKAMIDYTSRLTGEPQRLQVEFDPEAPDRVLRLVRRLPPAAARSAQAPASEADRIRAVDEFAGRLADAGLFSGVVLIARDGAPVYERAFGTANIETGEPNSLDTRFNVGSMNKAFTAFAIAQLVEQGKLSWDDPLGKFMPDFPDPQSASRIRIKHLLTHTSGLGNYFNERFMATPVTAFRDQNAYLAIAGGEPPAFEPGSDWSYSNTGYLALGFVIERVTGQDYYDYIDEHIYGRAGMRESGSLLLDQRHESLAVPYEAEYSDSGRRITSALDETPVRGSSAGGGVATARDLLRFSNAVRSNRLVSAATFATMSAPKPELGSPSYGYGIMKERFAGPDRDVVGHGGDAHGTCAVWGELRDTEVPYTVIILSNSAIGSCHPIARRIYGLFPTSSETQVRLSANGGSR